MESLIEEFACLTLGIRIYGPRRKKPYLWCFRPGHAQLQRLARMLIFCMKQV